ncbi:hypothetical protein PDIG_85110 [Penicillium digitatum PHI26]|uniref:Uncharacterized protein n=2 Tax=Penicillium digitatum TaxID=36651 RepID=K9F6R5_PEND2|nr:hypothetical protein PDIP_22770 [Penicillium digitatum Pd1]EKV05055.1 hypothetical protein PDIG_85110 [Penicillium digitatum PHI26]EKV19615.1 hypothetical protein PDIP_22770 [Penicillium digitatum Pd1]
MVKACCSKFGCGRHIMKRGSKESKTLEPPRTDILRLPYGIAS